MAKITYIDFEGTERTFDVANGSSVMQGAIDNGVPGIDADCGGECACATCHVYVEGDWFGKVGDRGEMEDSLLEFAEAPQDNSRLSCQIEVSDALEGLVVRTPEHQQ
jgi:2Fe-2S ferredoxin